MNHQENIISNIKARVESKTSLFDQKSNLWSSILETFFSFENQLDNIFIVFYQIILLFSILSEFNIKYQNNDWINNFVIESKIKFSISIFELSFLFENFSKTCLLIFVKRFFFSIFAMNSISIFRNLISKIIISKILDRFSFFRSNSNHLFVSKIFRNLYQIFNELIVLFYSFDQLNISFKNFRIFSQYFFKQSTLKLFFLFENRL